MGLKSKIRRTIEYAQKFNSRLSLEELKERLISKNICESKIIEKTVKENEEIGKLLNNSKNPYYKEKLKKAQNFSQRICKCFKSVIFIGVSGSVAAGRPEKNDDIDLLIICQKNTLWLSRFLVWTYMISHKIPFRNYDNNFDDSQLCLNLWLDEASLKIIKDKQNLRNAMDLVLLKPVYNQNHTYERFLLANDWVADYLATGYSKKLKKIEIKKKINEARLRESVFFLLNLAFFIPQFLFMKKKISKERIDLHTAMFHPKG